MIFIECGIADGRVYLSSSGHAGFAAKGHDVLCAAVSSLVFGLAAAAIRCEDATLETHDEPETQAIVSASARNRDTVVLFRGFRDALYALSRQYKEYISFSDTGTAGDKRE